MSGSRLVHSRGKSRWELFPSRVKAPDGLDLAAAREGVRAVLYDVRELKNQHEGVKPLSCGVYANTLILKNIATSVL